jgi:SAM-dependent methyltransferase
VSRDVSILACPKCGGAPLVAAAESLACAGCDSRFPIEDGIPDLLVGERFHDESGCDVWENEEKTGRFLATSYLAPLIERLFGDRDPAGLRVLSIGCGVGSDVEVLGSRGYEAYGADAGGRPQLWRRRSFPERFYFANAKHLPFRSETFDFVFLCCVIPHIGVVGDTYETTPDHAAQRQAAWDEALRVLKRGGHILLSAPNKRCPLDLFHRKFHWVHLPRVHSPWETFLLSVDEYREQLVVRGGCRDFEVLPLEGYWGFFISSGYWFGRLLQAPIRLLFKLMSWESTRWLRGTFLNPWLVVRAQKS